MRSVFVVLLPALLAAAQGLPRASEADGFDSKHNQKLLRIVWKTLPEYEPRRQPDGSELPPRAPWPFVILVTRQENEAKERLHKNIWNDTRFALACHALRTVEIKPEKVVELPYLSGVQGIRDPTLIVLDRDFEVVGSIHRPKEFEAKLFLPLVLEAADREYAIRLVPYIRSFEKLLKAEEQLWTDEREVERLRERAVDWSEKGDSVKAAKLDERADRMERSIEHERSIVVEKVTALRATLRLKGEKEEPLPSVGRPLTKKEEEAIRGYRAFARNRNPVVRAAAVEDLGALDSPAMVAIILKAANDVDARVTHAAGSALGRMSSLESLNALVEGLSAGTARSRRAALRGVAELARPFRPATAPVIERLTAGDPEERRAAILALAAQRDPAGVAPLVAALDDKEPPLRVLAAGALGAVGADAAVPALVKLLDATDWQLRKACVEALGRIRSKTSIPPLLDRFEIEQGLLREVLQKTLVNVTGQDFRFDLGNWRRWWERFGDGFVVPSELELAQAKLRAARALDGYAKPDKRRYHTIETLSRRMVFVIDVSSSMRHKIPLPPDLPPEKQDLFESRVKIDIAKKELIDLLSGIDQHVHFNVITFAGRVRTWQERLVPGGMRSAAIKHVAALEPKEKGREQKTNTYGALMAAFGLAETPVPNWRARRSPPDTIFLVTDGLPTTGAIVEVPRLVDAITEFNRTRGAVIHVIVFDEIAATKLGALATRNGGQCVIRGY